MLLHSLLLRRHHVPTHILSELTEQSTTFIIAIQLQQRLVRAPIPRHMLANIIAEIRTGAVPDIAHTINPDDVARCSGMGTWLKIFRSAMFVSFLLSSAAIPQTLRYEITLRGVFPKTKDIGKFVIFLGQNLVTDNRRQGQQAYKVERGWACRARLLAKIVRDSGRCCKAAVRISPHAIRCRNPCIKVSACGHTVAVWRSPRKVLRN